MKVVGQGAFGKVYQVRRAGTSSEIYAMKVMHKDKIIQKSHVGSSIYCAAPTLVASNYFV